MDESKIVPITRAKKGDELDADIILDMRGKVAKMKNPVARQQIREALKKAIVTIFSESLLSK